MAAAMQRWSRIAAVTVVVAVVAPAPAFARKGLVGSGPPDPVPGRGDDARAWLDAWPLALAAALVAVALLLLLWPRRAAPRA